MKLNNLRKLAFLPLAILLLSSLVGCKSEESLTQLNYLADEEPSSLNPYISHSYSLHNIASLVFPGLFKRTSGGEAMPWLVEQVPRRSNGGINSNGFVLTYFLKKEAKWSDGAPVTSQDIVFTWRFLKLLKGWGYKVDPDPELIERIEVANDKQFKLILKRPYSPGVTEFFRWVFPSHILEKEENPLFSFYWKKPTVGAGPYLLADWERQRKMVFKVNSNYWGKAPSVNQLVIWFSRDEKKLDLFKKLASPVIWEAVSDFNKPKLKGLSEAFRYDERPAYRLFIYAFNMSNPPYNNKNLRQAVLVSMPKDEINTKYLLGERRFLHPQLSLPEQFGYLKKAPTYPSSSREAEKLLTEAGYKRGKGKVRVKGGRELTVELSATYFGNTMQAYEDEFNIDIFDKILQPSWERLGLKVERQWAVSNFYGDYATNGYLSTGQHILAYMAMPIPENGEFLPFETKEIPSLENICGRNVFFLSDKKIDRLYLRYLETYDKKEQGRLWQEIFKRFLSAYVGYPERYYPFRTVWKGNIRGLKPNPSHSGNFWNVEEWKLAD